MSASSSLHDEYFINHPQDNAGSEAHGIRPCGYSYFPFVGLLPRPPPEGLPVLLGAFSSFANMVVLLKVLGLGKKCTARGLPR
jgi:hypothetical protein